MYSSGVFDKTMGLREHRPYPGADPGAGGTGYGTGAGTCPAWDGRNGMPVVRKQGSAVGQVLRGVRTEVLGG